MWIVAQQNSMSFLTKTVSPSLSLFFFLTWLHHVPSLLSWDSWCQCWFHLLPPSSHGLKFCLLCLLYVSQKNMHLPIVLSPVCILQLLIDSFNTVSRMFAELSGFPHILSFSVSFYVWGKASLYSTGLTFAIHQFCFCLLQSVGFTSIPVSMIRVAF